MLQQDEIKLYSQAKAIDLTMMKKQFDNIDHIFYTMLPKFEAAVLVPSLEGLK